MPSTFKDHERFTHAGVLNPDLLSSIQSLNIHITKVVYPKKGI